MKPRCLSAGAVPDSGFSYFTHFELSQGGSSFLEQAVMSYTGGRANSSLFREGWPNAPAGGRRHAGRHVLQPLPRTCSVLIDTSPMNFTLDQHPVGVNVGYTWASNYFKQVFAVSAKVTNGLNADGSEILFGSTKNSKDSGSTPITGSAPMAE